MDKTRGPAYAAGKCLPNLWERTVNMHRNRRWILGLLFLWFLPFTGCDGGGSLRVMPSGVTLYETGSDVRSLAIQDGFAGMVLREGALEILDVSHPMAPRLLARFSTDPEAKAAMLDGILFLLDRSGLRRFDPAAAGGPVELAPIPLEFVAGDERSTVRDLAAGPERLFALYERYLGPGPIQSLYFAITPEGEATPFYAGGRFDRMDDILAVAENRLYARRGKSALFIDVDGPIGDGERRAAYSFRITSNPQVGPLDLQYDPTRHRMFEVIQKVEEAEGLPLFFVVHENRAEPIQGEFPGSVDAAETARLPFTGAVDRGFTVYATAMAVDGDRVYIALVSGEIAVFDVTQSDAPFRLDTLDTGLPDPADITELRRREMRIVDGHLFLGGEPGLIIRTLPEWAPEGT